ncbi:MAG: Acetyl esterase Axe7A precursor [Verrucomicrobiota bacterium]|jgi:cephalosporin-C deacetylase-like acetyl esterase
MRNLLLLLLAITLSATPADDRKVVLGLVDTCAQAPKVHEAEGFKPEGTVRAIFYDALTWQGKPTRVFAWIGLPAQREGKVPGMVLIHGGGGTAFKEWVQKWNDQGFAAISIAVEGQTDVNENKVKGRSSWARHAFAGPARDGTFADTKLPLKEQWMYHALADTMLANSLLRSLPEVDASKIGVMGISWGGVITSTVIGLDERFAFGIPTYGCGHLFDAENHWGRALHDNEGYKQVWDGMNYADRVKMPVLWLSWPQDAHFPLGCQAEHYRKTPGPRMVSLISKMGHSHPAGWNPPDSYAFAKSVVETGKPWGSSPSAKTTDGHAIAVFHSVKPLTRAVLVSTTDKGFTGTRKWIETPAAAASGGGGTTASAPLPPGTTAWYINAYADKLTLTSDYQEIK